MKNKIRSERPHSATMCITTLLCRQLPTALDGRRSTPIMMDGKAPV